MHPKKKVPTVLRYKPSKAVTTERDFNSSRWIVCDLFTKFGTRLLTKTLNRSIIHGICTSKQPPINTPFSSLQGHKMASVVPMGYPGFEHHGRTTKPRQTRLKLYMFFWVGENRQFPSLIVFHDSEKTWKKHRPFH